MAASIHRRSFLSWALSASALSLSQACAPSSGAPAKPADAPKPPAPAATAPPAAKPAEAKPAEQKPAADAKPAASTEPVKRGGQLVQAINWTYPHMDPHLSSIQYMMGYEGLYDSLVRFELVDPKTWDFKVVGNLATSWEQPDPQTAIFKLKQGVKFHDGSEFDASVAAWNFMRAKNHDKSQVKTQLAMLDTAEAADKYTLRLKLKQPYAPLLRSMAYVTGAYVRMISKTAFDKAGDDGAALNPVGTGPFKFKQWIKDDRLIMEKFPDYHANGADGKPLPYLDEVVGRYVPDPSVSLVDLQSGSVQLLEWVQTKDVQTVKSNANLVMTEMPWAGQTYFMVSFNTEAPPFNDVRVRQAALHAIDREGMAKALGFGVGAPYYYPDWAIGSPGYDDGIPKNEFNPAKVKELLAAAGQSNISIELKVIAREPENTIGEFVQNMWTNAGIKTKLVSLERLAWIDEVRAKKFQSCFWRGTLITSVDPELLNTRIKCGGSANWGQWCDKEIDKLMDDGASTLDPKKRDDIYKQILRLIQERAYLGTGIAMPLLTSHRKEVMGVTMNYQVPNIDRIWLNK
ncbi:MAG: ABC transporter substrate-binding protein [Chloroflexota bacterium]